MTGQRERQEAAARGRTQRSSGVRHDSKRGGASVARRQEALDQVNLTLGTNLNLKDFDDVADFPLKVLALRAQAGDGDHSVHPPLETNHDPKSMEAGILVRFQRSFALGSLPDERQAARLRLALSECVELVRGRLHGLEPDFKSILLKALLSDPRKARRQWSAIEANYAVLHAADWAGSICSGLTDEVHASAERKIAEFMAAFGIASTDCATDARPSTGNFSRGYRTDFARMMKEYLTTTRPNLSQKTVVETIANLWVATDLRADEAPTESQMDQVIREVGQALGTRAPRKNARRGEPPV